MSDSAKTPSPRIRTVVVMNPKFHAIGIVVADMASSLAFYRDLGLDVPSDADGAPHVELELPGGPALLLDTQDTIRSFDPSWTPPSGSPGISLAFLCGDPAGVDATHDALVAAGHRSHLAPWDAFWGQRYASVLDPDGNVVDLFATLPAS
jgi:catechol 2,3-dioxygenase-like lactoylglutathione lyase family enzyme